MMFHELRASETRAAALGRPAPPEMPLQTTLPTPSDIAVIVACQGDGSTLFAALDSVFNQKMLAPREIVVVLDNCNDEEIKKIRTSLPGDVTVFETRCSSPILCWRRGVRATSAPILCFLDGKHVLSPTFLADSVPFFLDSRVGMVTGVESAWEGSEIGGAFRSTRCTRPAEGFANSLVRRMALEGTRAFECFAPEWTEQEPFAWKRIVEGGGWETRHGPARFFVQQGPEKQTLSHHVTPDSLRTRIFAATVNSPRIRAILLGSSLRMGGVVRHLEMLWKHRCHVDWIGSVLSDGGMSDDASIQLISEMMPVLGGVPADRINSNLLERRECAEQALAELLNRGADVVYAWGNVTELVKQPSRQLPVVFGLHGAGPWSQQLVRDVHEHVAAFVSVCEECTDYVPPSTPGYLIFNGVDLSRLTPVKSRHQTRATWGISHSQVAVGFVGRWSSEKQPLALARIIAELGSEAIGVYCCPQQYAGTDLIPTREKQQALEIAQGRLVWTSMENAAEVYRALDCLLIPSLTEGGPLVALEAFVCGCPVVATPVGMLPMLFQEYGGIFQMVPFQATVGEWGTAVNRAMTPGFRPNVEQARELAIHQFSAADMTRRWEEVLLQSVRRRKSPHSA